MTGTSGTHGSNGNGTSHTPPPHLDAREDMAALVDLLSDLDGLLADHGERLPAGLVGQLRLDLQRAVDRLQQHRRRLRATQTR